MSDGRSDVCSSDLGQEHVGDGTGDLQLAVALRGGQRLDELGTEDARVLLGHGPGQLGVDELNLSRSFDLLLEDPPVPARDTEADRKSGRVVKECVSTGRTRWTPYYYKKKRI